jgi:hypothetical protein
LQGAGVRAALPFMAGEGVGMEQSGSRDGDAGLSRIGRIMEGAILGRAFPLNGCLGLAIFHGNCCVRKLTVSRD